MLVGMAVLATLTAATATASAGQMTVTAAITHEVTLVDANPTYRHLKSLKITTVSQARAAIPKLTTIAGLFTTAASTVSAASATARQQPGKTDWVNGAREGARGFRQFAAALTFAVRGEKSAAQNRLSAAEGTIDAGSALGRKGDKILGLPLTD